MITAPIAAHLPETDPSDEHAGHGILHDSWFDRFSAPTVVLLPVADDLADIWRDLKPEVEALPTDAAGRRYMGMAIAL
jgi:hypothetical protein